MPGLKSVNCKLLNAFISQDSSRNLKIRQYHVVARVYQENILKSWSLKGFKSLKIDFKKNNKIIMKVKPDYIKVYTSWFVSNELILWDLLFVFEYDLCKTKS